MSTEFISNTTEEIAFLRYAGGHKDGASFDFASVTNFENVLTALDKGETFIALGGSELASDPDMTREAFEQLAATGRATFGVMSFTLELGSGDFARLFTER